jgi:hypothetical protein
MKLPLYEKKPMVYGLFLYCLALDQLVLKVTCATMYKWWSQRMVPLVM